MNIHPLWFLCIFVRLSIIGVIWYFNKYTNFESNIKKIIKVISVIFLLSIGIGFLNKALTGSNNEIQIAKVFWHETRYVHSGIYLLSAMYLLNNNVNICLLLLLLDVIFSILYRFIFNK